MTNRGELKSGKLKCSLHQYVMRKWYGAEIVKSMYENGYIIEHLDNKPHNCVISNLEFLLKDYNTAKGQSLDKDIIKSLDKFALSMYKDFKKGNYEIAIAFNQDTNFFDENRNVIRPLKAIHLLYGSDYYFVILQAQQIIHNLVNTKKLQLNKLSFEKIMIEEAFFLELSPEEKNRTGNGKGGIIVRNGKVYLIPGKNCLINSVSQVTNWDK